MSSCVDWTLGHCDLLSPQRSVKAAWVSLPSCILPVWSSAGSPSDTPPPAPSAPELLLPPDTVWKSEPTQTSHHVYSTGYSGNISGSAAFSFMCYHHPLLAREVYYKWFKVSPVYHVVYRLHEKYLQNTYNTKYPPWSDVDGATFKLFTRNSLNLMLCANRKWAFRHYVKF